MTRHPLHPENTTICTACEGHGNYVGAAVHITCLTCEGKGFLKTVTAADGTVFAVPAPHLLARYAVAMFGADHAPLDDDALVSIAAQAALDVDGNADPYGVRG